MSLLPLSITSMTVDGTIKIYQTAIRENVKEGKNGKIQLSNWFVKIYYPKV
jgi:hypothetical protein